MSQIPTGSISIHKLMMRAGFARGVADMRAGTPPDFDAHDSDTAWEYERGRQWAAVAPPGMPLKINGQLNPLAAKFMKGVA